MRLTKILLALSLVLIFVGTVTLAPVVHAGDRVLSVNRGNASDMWYITGEPSLVMNGFDLTPLKILNPATIDKVTFVVDTPVPSQSVELVIYEDVNGGSPVDAKLVYRQSLTITTRGTLEFKLPEPVVINAPVVWIGFYLPVDFKFMADMSGTSVLTYWAWKEGGTFDLANLSSADVIGPADGSAPVGINMKGKARITAEITGANPLLGTPVIFQSYQTAGSADADLGHIQEYPHCKGLGYDTGDVNISYNNAVNVHCKEVNSMFAPAAPAGYERRGTFYDVFMYYNQGRNQPNLWSTWITHCITPPEGDRERALVGVAYGAPRVWRILPTQRFGDKVCAEIPHDGNVSYFVPKS